MSQVVYKEKDSDAAPSSWSVEGNTSHSVQLTALGKYVLYEIQVLAFTRIGDGRSSSPSILERTLDDGKHAVLNNSTVFCVCVCFSVQPACNKLLVICHAAVPGPPVGILFPEVRTTSVRLIWQPPAQPNGIILGELRIFSSIL